MRDDANCCVYISRLKLQVNAQKAGLSTENFLNKYPQLHSQNRIPTVFFRSFEINSKLFWYKAQFLKRASAESMGKQLRENVYCFLEH